MHYAAILGQLRGDQISAGWQVPEDSKHDWLTMVGRVQAHIKKTNFGYRG
jgi:hypothetical protein